MQYLWSHNTQEPKNENLCGWMKLLFKKTLKRNVKHSKDTYILEKEQPTWNTAKLEIKLSDVVGKQYLSLKNQ